MLLDTETLSLSQKIWDYHHVNHPLKPADCILVLGSHDTRVAERGADLFMEEMAPLLILSGGLGRLTAGNWTEPEAEIFARIARNRGIPDNKILIENRSTNTGENIRFTYQKLQENKLAVKSIILVQKPYMERRAYATFMQQWPGESVELMVNSPQISFVDYPNADISQQEVINIMLGDLQRIKSYPAKGFQIAQSIPDEVWEAYEQLTAKGFIPA